MGRLVEGRRGVKRKATTRTDFSKKICGKPSELDETEPPINSQIIQHGYFLSNSYPDKDENEICTMVHRDVVKVWTAVNPRLKLLEEKVAKQKIHRLLANAYDYNNKHLTVVQRKNLEAKLDKLFDLAACKCKLPIRPCNDRTVKCKESNCDAEHIVCECPLDIKVPQPDREYLKDQRAKKGPKGKFQLGSPEAHSKYNIPATSSASRPTRPSGTSEEPSADTSEEVAANQSANTSASATEEDNTTTDQCSDSDEEYVPSKCDSQFTRNVTDFPRMGMELVRGEVSSRLGAAIGNSLILDLHSAGFLKPDLDLEEVLLDKSKLDRQKKNVKETTATRQKREPDNFHLQCVGFDGRNDDNTLIINPATKRQDTAKEHHLTFTKETEKDEGTYLTHRTLPLVGATGQVMATEIAHVLGEYESRESIKAMLCDNTPTNTGHKTAAVASLETILDKKLHTMLITSQ